MRVHLFLMLCECNRASQDQMWQMTFREPNVTNDIFRAKCDKRHFQEGNRVPRFSEAPLPSEAGGMENCFRRTKNCGSRGVGSVNADATECGTL